MTYAPSHYDTFAGHELTRDRWFDTGELVKCIAEDDWLEDHGMHGDDRMTCHRHQCWTEDCPGEHS